MKSFKSVFRSSKKKDKQSTEATTPTAPIKHSIPSPSPSSTHLPEIPSAENHSRSGNGSSAQSIGHHSNASAISRADGVPTEEAPLPPVPAVPATWTTDSSVVDQAGLAQPHSPAPTPVPTSSGTASQQTSPVVPPANPQLVQNSPLVSTLQQQQVPLEADLSDSETRPTEHDLRSPHAVQIGVEPERAAAVAPASTAVAESTTVPSTPTVEDEDALQTNGHLPPSYNSLNIPLPGNIHAASAPSPDGLHAPAQVPAAVEGSSSLAPSPSMSYVAPPPASPLSTPLESVFQAGPPNSIHTQSQPWATQQAYSPLGGAQHYAHRPYVMPGSENQTYPIIMAIDWGTTYSSMAYAYQQDGEVHEVSTWPKQTHNYPKVPTCNLYGPGSKEILEWGYSAKVAITKPPFKNHVLLSKYKLHLDDASGPHPPLPNGLTVVDAIADYLRLFHAHVVQSVLKGFGAAFEQQHIQYCLSVPAMWTDNAKAMMRQAALQAGMITPLDPPHRLLLISEPEAAALYCEKKCDQFSIGHGQRFMICDAGGGTVDLIVFEVAVGPTGRTLREVTRGSGHSCGSIFLDERMEALLRKRFAKWQEKGLTAANWVQLMENFIHNVKPLFDGVEDQYITMPAVPGRADLTDYDIGLEDGVLTVTAEEMRREVFDPVVNDVLRLIQHQLQQTHFQCHAIFLVGGFGCSGYLHNRVQAEFGSRVPMIGVPPRAELAVVRGAAYAGLMPRTITQRVARRWYGVDSLMAYEEGHDLAHKKVRDREGMIRARDRFSVYVSPGQQIGVDECITKRYITYQYPKPVNSPLFACSSMSLPRYVDSPMVEKIGDFLIPLPFVPGAQPGHKMVFELRMYFGATEIRAEAEVNGMVVSTRCQFSG
ncbi:hypothetical protein EMPS_07974 [Entomortierella parvispora]|uniref:Actin-like ATPase domain-containing protein n=1 Tax=Entomortierella parvispora TaxID=205924 RepID=A0A9P3HFG7_9FUNG|nr:hypothetical protein EMPS_07974 [Entomortierella parvispora]